MSGDISILENGNVTNVLKYIFLHLYDIKNWTRAVSFGLDISFQGTHMCNFANVNLNVSLTDSSPPSNASSGKEAKSRLN